MSQWKGLASYAECLLNAQGITFSQQFQFIKLISQAKLELPTICARERHKGRSTKLYSSNERENIALYNGTINY